MDERSNEPQFEQTASPLYLSPSPNQQPLPTNICLMRNGTTVRRTTAAIITTKSNRVSPQSRTASTTTDDQQQQQTLAKSSPPSPNDDTVDTASLTSSTTDTSADVEAQVTSDSLRKPFDSYNCLIEECLVWISKFLHRHVLYYFEIHDSSLSSIQSRPETRLLQCTVYPWLQSVIQSKFISDEKTCASISHLVDVIRNQLGLYQITVQESS